MLNMPLLDKETKRLTWSATAAVRMLFEEFATSDPKTPDRLYLDADRIKELGLKVSDKSSLRPSSLLAYVTTDDLSKIEWDDFINYYEQNATQNPDMVRANLSYAGLRSDMKTVPKPGDPDESLMPYKNKEDMPRFKLSNDPETFQTLLHCLDLHRDSRNHVVELITTSCINERISNNVIELGQNIFEWDSSNKDSTKELVYSLTLIQLIFESEDNEHVQGWVPKFLKSGGLNRLNELLDTALALLGQEDSAIEQ